MSKPQPLFDQIALVTGASSGIGRAAALELARSGANLALAARSAAALEQVAAEVRAMGREALVVPTDVTRREQVEAAAAATLARWGRVDILVANAGQYIRAPAAAWTIDKFEQSLAVNFYGSLYAVLAVLPGMLSRRRGHIVLVTSMDAKTPLPPDAPYVAAKCALSGVGDVLRQELHGSGVRVTVVYPGRVATPMLDNLNVPWVSAKIPPEAVGQAIVRAIWRRQAEVLLPVQVWLLYLLRVGAIRLSDWTTRFLRLSGWEDQ
jgi:NADP-dependent 3-hydroxy acid dehydrogenase YdfG